METLEDTEMKKAKQRERTGTLHLSCNPNEEEVSRRRSFVLMSNSSWGAGAATEISSASRVVTRPTGAPFTSSRASQRTIQYELEYFCNKGKNKIIGHA